MDDTREVGIKIRAIVIGADGRRYRLTTYQGASSVETSKDGAIVTQRFRSLHDAVEWLARVEVVESALNGQPIAEGDGVADRVGPTVRRRGKG
jgi:hypothetical protein